jgi:choloylglycine hydrolase
VRRWLVGLVVLAGCGGAAAAPRETPRKVDAYPLWEYTDRAPAPAVHIGAAGACTVFFGAGGEPILGRNFDYHDQPALLLRHRPPGAYASLSLVDTYYLGVDRAHLSRIDDPGALRDAAAIPFDGMNERGVAVAMAAVPSARAAHGRRTGSLGVMRLVLDHAANVAEAVAIFRRTAPDFSDGEPLHYMVADASGASAVIEYVNGRVHVIGRGARPYQAMTNFIQTGAHGADHRYRGAIAALERSGGRLTPDSTLAILRGARQRITRWSAAYDLRTRELHVIMGQKYGSEPLTFKVAAS